MSCPAHDIAKSRKMLIAEDVDLIIYAAQQLPKERTVHAVDLGFGESGTSTLAIFAGRGENVRVIGIDPQIHWGSLAVVNIGQADRFQAMVNSADEVPMDEIGLIDLLLVDCLPEETEKTLRRWLPKLQPEGYVWVHDYGDPVEFGLPTPKNEAVAEGIKTLMGEGLLSEVKVAGLGWLGQSGREKMAMVGMTAEEPEAVSPPEVPETPSDPAEPPKAPLSEESAQFSKGLPKKKTGRPKGSKNKLKE